jgi:hypothetical protein
MLFDLRSRGRRTTVRGVYLTLAILMGGGLILFGVGTGVSGGGLLNAFGGGGGGSQNQTVSAAEKSAEKAVKANPSSPAAWAQLVQARWTSAGQGGNYDAATQTFTASGKKELAKAGQAWQRYLQLTGGKDPKQIAVLAGRVYASEGDYAGEASAWEVQAAATPGQVKSYECLALSSYAAGQTRKGDLALDKALTLVPKAQRKTLTTNLQAAKTNPKLAQQC